MKKFLVLLICTVTLVACGDFNEGDRVRSYTQHDPFNKCRIIITESGSDSVPPMTAIIEGCNNATQ